jgi:lipopolysaccharide transport system ATP-binding protein
MRRMEVVDDIAVAVRNVSKRYPRSDSQFARLRDTLAAGNPDYDAGFWAVRNISFTVRRGEAFGIIGSNGSGKSTLLQMIAGILRPTSGEVNVIGRLSALLELGSGFSPEFTGRDNVYLNGSVLGLSREEIDERFDQIVNFAQIGDFLDQPIRTYSTGMVLRLAFSVAAHVHPEVLIVDEALAVGDIAFRQRCMRKIHDLRAGGTTILFVSHEASDVKALCERCLWLQNGHMQELGPADEVVAKYLAMTVARETSRLQADAEEAHHHRQLALEQPAEVTGLVRGFPQPLKGHRYGSGTAAILGCELLDAVGDRLSSLGDIDRFVLNVSFHATAPIDSPIIGFLFRNARGETLFGTNTARENYPLEPLEPGHAGSVQFHSAIPDLPPGDYAISVAISDGTIDDFVVCDYIEDAIEVRRDAAPDETSATRGYFQLRCSSVAIHKT